MLDDPVKLLIPLVAACLLPVFILQAKGPEGASPTPPRVSNGHGLTCRGCGAAIDGNIKYRGSLVCASCREVRRKSADTWTERDITRVLVGLVFAFGICFGAGVGVIKTITRGWIPPLRDGRVPLSVGAGYAVFFGLAVVLTYLYNGTLQRDDKGYYPPEAFNVILGGWLIGVIVVQFVSCRTLLRLQDGTRLGSLAAAGLSLAMLPGFLVAMLFSAIAGQGP